MLGERTPGTHVLDGLVGRRAGHCEEEKHLLIPLAVEPWIMKVVAYSLYLLSYSDPDSTAYGCIMRKQQWTYLFVR
jgi:hypothetical protein